jgi:hypothetical protein
MPFLTPLKVQLLNDREKLPWITLEPLVYEAKDGTTYTVPKHFRTDGASIPKALLLLPVIGVALFQRYFGVGVWQGFKDGVLHDYLRRKRNGTTVVDAATAHRIFKEALEESGYPEDLVSNYYDAVRKFNP